MKTKKFLALFLCIIIFANNIIFALNNNVAINSEIKTNDTNLENESFSEDTETIIEEKDIVKTSTDSETLYIEEDEEISIADTNEYEEEEEEKIDISIVNVNEENEDEISSVDIDEEEKGVNFSNAIIEKEDEINIATESNIDSEDVDVNLLEESEKDDDSNSLIANDVDELLISTTSEVEKIDELQDSTIDEQIALETNEIATQSVINENLYGNENSFATPSEPSEIEEKNEWLHGYGGTGIVKNKKTIKKSNKNKLFGDNSLPSSYDARTETNPNNQNMSIVSPVKSQMLGDCWAQSTIALVETSIRKKGLVTTEEQSNLSEMALIYNSYHLKDVTNDATYLDKPGVEGNDYAIRTNSETAYLSSGDPVSALMMASSYMGFVTEDNETAYNYNAIQNIIDNGMHKKYAFNSNSFVVANAEIIVEDKDKVKKAIMENGSVQFPLCADHSATNTREVDGEWYYYTDEGSHINHSLVTVGWDDNVPRTNFVNTQGQSPAHNGAWLCKNSWGTNADYHKAGYFWLSYEDPALGDLYITVDAIKAGTYKYNYHYDTTMYYDYMSPASIWDGGTLGNVFKVSNDEDQKLEAINVATALYSGSTFDIEIYTNSTQMTNPTDGTLKLTQTYNTNGKNGITTIPLNTSVNLTKGTYYSIVIKSPNNGSVEVYLDKTKTTGNEQYYNEVEEGQSFYKNSNASTWTDYNTDANVTVIDGKKYGTSLRIKGLANPVSSSDPEPTPDPTPEQKKLTNIIIKNAPTKTSYNEGEKFDPTGLVINLTFSDNSTQTVTYNDSTKSSFSFTPSLTTALNVNNTTITIKYETATTTQKIEVLKINPPTPTPTPTPTPAPTPSPSPSQSRSSSSSSGSGPILQIMNQINRNVVSNTNMNRSFSDVSMVANSTNRNWSRNANGKWNMAFTNALGEAVEARNSFVNIDTVANVNGQQIVIQDFYFFNDAGDMVTGWLTDSNNKTRFFETTSGNDEGKMVRGWKKILDKYYYFDAEGFLFTNGLTPDGYAVDSSGVWIN